MKVRYYFLVLSICITIGCINRTVDLEPPSVQFISTTPEPINAEICGDIQPDVYVLTGGDQLIFDAIFTDDKALSQYKVDIHNNFDCHGHGGGSAPSFSPPDVDNQTIDWSILDIADIEGTTASVERIFEVPENVTAGNYHYHIQVIDAEGNDSPFTNFFALKITNPLDNVAPEIYIEEPTSNILAVSKGENVRFKGKVTDNRSLGEGGNGVLYLSYTDLSSGNTFNTDQAFIFEENTSTEYSFDFEYTIPETLTSGAYRLSLGANDGVRNVGAFQFFNIEIE